MKEHLGMTYRDRAMGHCLWMDGWMDWMDDEMDGWMEKASRKDVLYYM
jgi:hypothetical protein